MSFVTDDKSPSLINFGIYLKPSLLPASSPSAPSPPYDDDDEDDDAGNAGNAGSAPPIDEQIGAEYRFSKSGTNYANGVGDFALSLNERRGSGGEKTEMRGGMQA